MNTGLLQVVVDGAVAHTAALDDVDIDFGENNPIATQLAQTERFFGMEPGDLSAHIVVHVQATGNILIKHQDVYGA